MYTNVDWAAGFIEGDGCFSVNSQQGGKYRYPKIEVHQKNLEPLYTLRDQLGFSLTTNGRLGVAYVVGARAQNIYNEIYPLLSSKRRTQTERNLLVGGNIVKVPDLNWFAGYYEAEGCIFIKNNGQTRVDGTRRLFCQLSIAQYYSEETSMMCMTATGIGSVSGPYMAKGERRAYAYNLAGQPAIDLVSRISDRLSQAKIDQLNVVIQRLDSQ